MKKIQLFLALLFITVTTFAQRTDFSGTWKLEDQHSISGNLYSNGVPKQITVAQKKDSARLEKITANQHGEDVATTEALALNGKSFEGLTASKRKKVMTLTWSDDGKSFSTTSNLYNPSDASKLEFTITDNWSLEDGKLIMVRKNQNFTNGEVWESKAIYQKQ